MPANCKSRFGRFCDIYCTVILLCVTCHYILWSSSGFWRLWAKRHSWRAGKVIRCVYMYTVTVQNTWSVCQAAVHISLAFSLIAIPHPHVRLLFPSGASWPVGNIRTPRKWVETIFVGSWASPLVCFHCALHSFLRLWLPSASATRSLTLKTRS